MGGYPGFLEGSTSYLEVKASSEAGKLGISELNPPMLAHWVFFIHKSMSTSIFILQLHFHLCLLVRSHMPVKNGRGEMKMESKYLAVT